MPDGDQIFVFLLQILKDPVWVAGAAVGALCWILFVIYLFKEMFQNVRSRYGR